MKASPDVWFVTHEQHPDPRIWNFARAFAEIGANVTYFWAPDPLPRELAGCRPINLPALPPPRAHPLSYEVLGKEAVDILCRIRDLLARPGMNGMVWKEL